MRSRYIFYVQVVYLVACALWIMLLGFLGVFSRPFRFANLILAIPVIVYAFGFSNSSTHERVESDMFRSDFVSVALVFVILFIKWVDKRPTSPYILRTTLTAFALIVVSMIDVWVSYRAVGVEKHIKSALHTAGITLLLHVLFVYYADSTGLDSSPYHRNTAGETTPDADSAVTVALGAR